MARTRVGSGDEPRPDHDTWSPDLRAVYERLTPLCAASLVDSFDRARNLFSHQLLDGTWREIDEIYPHESLTSTAIALIGMSRAGIDPAAHGIDADACIAAIISEFARTGYLGGVGLALWANAVAGSDRSGTDLLAAVGLSPAALVSDVLPTLTTMETAWCASGLLHEVAYRGDTAVRGAAVDVVGELRTNRYVPATSLMNHAGPGAPPLDRARAHIANFADQIYSVQAFAFASIVLGDHDALRSGTDLARRHCELQGELGQWWWHVDARRGHIALRYAVYSVHQHGMAPMALLALAAAGASDMSSTIHRAVEASVAWIDHNELGASMVDIDRSTVWRSLERVESPAASRVRGVLEALGTADTRRATVRLNRETRPYEWAWCLYAAAISDGTPKGRSVV